MATKTRKVIPLGPEAVAALKDLRKAFIQKFGRPPKPDDPLFFDPYADTPQLMSLERVRREMLKMLAISGAPPEVIYAFEKTGRIVTEPNTRFLTKAEVREWEEAIEDFKRSIQPE